MRVMAILKELRDMAIVRGRWDMAILSEKSEHDYTK